MLIDRDGAAFRAWGPKVLPATYVLDGAGLVCYVAQGPLEWDSAEVVALLRGLEAGEDRPRSH